jgi:orotate phosphoribosyltransferase
MIFNKDTAEKTAELLLQINAIKLNPKNPFTWASGWKSPIYCDNRLITFISSDKKLCSR